jgi:lysozyme
MRRIEFVPLAIEVAAALARRFEGFVPHPYLCPAGVPSIGYGATYYENGRAVKLTDPPITRARAESLLIWAVRTIYLPAVLRLCPAVDTPERLAALIDFVFNLGAGRLRDSTLRRKVNAGDWDAARVQVMRWVMGGGRKLRGLERRRAAERDLM